VSLRHRSPLIALTLALGAGYLLWATPVSSSGAAGNVRANASPSHSGVSGHAGTVNLSGYSNPVCGSTNAATTITTHETWTAANSPYVVGCLVTVARGGQITMEPGTVVKLGLNGLGDAFYVQPGGSINVAGTAKDQVVVTSFRDNGVGGPTAPTDSPPPSEDYWWAFFMDGGSSVRINHADVRYGVSAITEGAPSGSCLAKGDVSLSVTNSTLTSPVVLGACDGATGSHYRVSDNTFTMPSGMTALSDTGFPSDSLAVSSNTFNFTGSSTTVALQISNSNVEGIDLSGRATNTFRHSSGPVSVNLTTGVIPTKHSWIVSSGKHMSLTGTLEVEGSLTLEAGASLTSSAAISVGEHGSLRVEGTSSRPVLFSDGASISTSGDSFLSVEHAVFSGDLGGNVIQETTCNANDGGATVSIKSSTIGGEVALGKCDERGDDTYTIEDNRFDNAKGFTALALTVEGNYPPKPGQLIVVRNKFSPVAVVTGERVSDPAAMEVTIAGWTVNGVALSGPSSNVFTGQGVSRVIGVDMAIVPATTTWELSPSSGAVLVPAVTTGFNSTGAPGLVVDGVLKLDPGFVVKIGNQAGGEGGIDLGTSGSLVAIGTSARPIVVTSSADDSVDGNSNGGAPTSPSQSDYQVAIQADEGSTVDVAHAKLRDGWFAFYDQCAVKPQSGGGFALTSSLIDDELSVGDCDGSQHSYIAQIEGNTFGATFDGATSGQFAIGGGYDPSALQPAVYLENIDPSFFALSGPNANVFKGSGAGKVVALLGTTIASGQRWSVSSSSGAVLAPWPDLDYLTSPGITVRGSLIVSPGTIIKSAMPGIAVDVTESGDLNLDGTATSPVIFTSVNDDKVGGDSNGNSSAPTPKTGDYGTAIQFDHLSGPHSISHAVFEYATDALSYQFMSHDAAVSDSDFANNGDAIEVEETSGVDYQGIGNLPCVPPWFSAVISDSNWYGTAGNPAPNIDLSGLAGALPERVSYNGTAYNLGTTVSQFDSEKTSFGGGNTVPWAIYSCKLVKFPWPAVYVSGTPGAPNYPRVDPKP
jgi:hypothetical protein